MGDIEVANQLIQGVNQALAVVGDTTILTIFSTPSVDIDNPGANPNLPPVTKSFEVFLFDFDEKYMPDANIEEGQLMGIIDVSTFTEVEKESIAVGNFLSEGTTQHTIVQTNPIKVAGIIVTVVVQLR